MSITTTTTASVTTTILEAIVRRFPRLGWDYEAVAAPLAVGPEIDVPDDADWVYPADYAFGTCPIEDAISSRSITATLAALLG